MACTQSEPAGRPLIPRTAHKGLDLAGILGKYLTMSKMSLPSSSNWSATVTANGVSPGRISAVREFNRVYTNLIGLLHGSYLDSPYSLTEARVLFELAHGTECEISALRSSLDIDAGYLSRILARFETDGLITRERSTADARRRVIALTGPGWAGEREYRAGDRVLLAALPGEDTLAAYTLAVVDRALRVHVPFLCGEGGRS